MAKLFYIFEFALLDVIRFRWETLYVNSKFLIAFYPTSFLIRFVGAPIDLLFWLVGVCLVWKRVGSFSLTSGSTFVDDDAFIFDIFPEKLFNSLAFASFLAHDWFGSCLTSELEKIVIWPVFGEHPLFYVLKLRLAFWELFMPWELGLCNVLLKFPFA